MATAHGPANLRSRRDATVPLEALRPVVDDPFGFVVIDKPAGLTSHNCVSRLRRWYGLRRVGHGGTLDPLASGVLPIALGEATKTLPYVVDTEKRYQFTLHWGVATSTDDREGDIIETCERRPSEAEIRDTLPQFIGEIMQVPPVYSAIKVNGQRAYDLARDGEEVELDARSIFIGAFDLVGIEDADHAVFTVVSGKGAYMRGLARDLARALGTVGHIASLRRNAVGPFKETDAISLDELGSFGQSPAASGGLRPVETPLDDIPALAVNDTQASRIRQGQAVSPQTLVEPQGETIDPGQVVYVHCAHQPVAIGRIDAMTVKPLRVFNL